MTTNTLTAAPPRILPRAFWFYLLGIHAVYALILTQQFSRLQDPSLSFGFLSFAEFSAVLDLVLIPALVYGVLARRQPKQAVFGALGMMMLGLLALRMWFPRAEMGSILQWLIDTRSLLLPLLWGIAIALELYVIWQLLRFLRKPMKEGAIALLIEPLAQNFGRDHWLCRYVAAETRIWIYGLSRKLPHADDFAGDDHFSYATQNANASTWLGLAIANIVPTPLFHFILDRIHWGLAWITTIITLVSSFWMWAEYRATQARPISLTAEKLLLRYGTLIDREINLTEIISYRTLSWRDLEAKSLADQATRQTSERATRPTRYVGMGGANVELKLANSETIWLGIDQPKGFLAALDRRISVG
jgi:hypothetical protein